MLPVLPVWQVRLNFLSRLLDEAFSHLHNHLCASVLGVKLAVLPFSRDVTIDQGGAALAHAMRACCQYMLQVIYMLHVLARPCLVAATVAFALATEHVPNMLTLLHFFPSCI